MSDFDAWCSWCTNTADPPVPDDDSDPAAWKWVARNARSEARYADADVGQAFRKAVGDAMPESRRGVELLRERGATLALPVLQVQVALELLQEQGADCIDEAESLLRVALSEMPNLAETAEQEVVMQHPRLAAIVEEARAAAGEGEAAPEEAEAP